MLVHSYLDSVNRGHCRRTSEAREAEAICSQNDVDVSVLACRISLLNADWYNSVETVDTLKQHYILVPSHVRETYLYHLHRLDHRHNFSPYFYLIYLAYPNPSSEPYQLSLWRSLLRSPLTSFVPQMILSLGTGVMFGRKREHLVFAWFVQTVVFVIFNKVCTSQVCRIIRACKNALCYRC